MKMSELARNARRINGAKGGRPKKTDVDTEEKLWSNVDKTEDCWIWKGGKDKDGYGVIRMNCRTVKTHRLAWQCSFGEIPSGQYVLHRCDNPPCVNPSHLFLGTAKQNTQDMVQKGRGTTPPDQSKITKKEVWEICELKKKYKFEYREIAKMYNLSISRIFNIVNPRKKP